MLSESDRVTDRNIRAAFRNAESPVSDADARFRSASRRGQQLRNRRRRGALWAAGVALAGVIALVSSIIVGHTNRQIVAATAASSSEQSGANASMQVKSISASAEIGQSVEVSAGPASLPGPSAAPHTLALHDLFIRTLIGDAQVAVGGIQATANMGGDPPGLAVVGPGCSWAAETRSIICTTLGRPPESASPDMAATIPIAVIANDVGLEPLRAGTYACDLTVSYVSVNDPEAIQTVHIGVRYEIG